MNRFKSVFNDDATMLMDVQPGRARESLVELIDRIIDNVPVDIYAIECALPDICEYETKVGEVRGRRMSQSQKDKRLLAIDALRDEGTDHLTVYLERLHERGIECLAEVRMNDTHHHTLDPEVSSCSMFAIEHPQWVIRRHDGVSETALDYSFSEVREHRLSIIHELVNEYDIDGLELNFNRWAKHFERGKGREKAPIMTEFVGQVRALLDEAARRRNRDCLRLMVWMPSTIDECCEAGCDVRSWVEKGWVNDVVVAEYNNTWPGTQVDQFAEFCNGRCNLYVQMSNQCGAIQREPRPRITGRGPYQSSKRGEGYNGMLLMPDEARGAAANYYAWGADGIAFWNIACTTGDSSRSEGGQAHRSRMFDWMNQVLDPKTIDSGPRRYHYIPIYKGIGALPARNYAFQAEGHSPAGACKGQVISFDCSTIGKRQAFAFRMADGRDGSSVQGRLRFRTFQILEPRQLEVDINGRLVDDSFLEVQSDSENIEMESMWWSIELNSEFSFQGDNELGLTWRGTACDTDPYMEELDIVIS